jgi:hypothetical protein
MINAALQGYGIVELPQHSTTFKEGVTEILPDIQGIKIDIYFIFSQSRQKSKKLTYCLSIYLKNLHKKQQPRCYYFFTIVMHKKGLSLRFSKVIRFMTFPLMFFY